MNFWLQAFHRQIKLSSLLEETAAEVVEVVLEGGGVVDLESLLEPEDVWASGTGGDMATVM